MPRRRATRSYAAARSSTTVTLREVAKDHSEFRANFDDAYDKFTDFLDNESGEARTFASIVELVMAAIRFVEVFARTSGDSGAAKKELVLALITRLIADSPMAESNKVAVQSVLEAIGPAMIDGFIAADKGKLLAHGWAKIRERFSGCCK